MQLQEANRRRVKIKMALQGSSGSGKTKSALFIAYGLCSDWTKIAVIDTENRSSELYSDVGRFKVLHMQPPFSPERYIEALNVCLSAGIKVIIIDSLTHEWEYITDVHSQLQGNSFTNWGKLTPRHNAFVQAMLQADAHVIGTIRTKQDYVLSEKDGKKVPEKVGLKGVQRDGLDYDFTLVLELDATLHAKVSKDRTQMFKGKPEFIPTIETGKQILEWCNKGVAVPPVSAITVEMMIAEIRKCKSDEDLNYLYYAYPMFQKSLLSEFSKQRQIIHGNNPSSNTSKPNYNGSITNYSRS